MRAEVIVTSIPRKQRVKYLESLLRRCGIKRYDFVAQWVYIDGKGYHLDGQAISKTSAIAQMKSMLWVWKQCGVPLVKFQRRLFGRVLYRKQL